MSDCECYQVGGRFIAEDPDCPIHQSGGYTDQINRLTSELEQVKAERDTALERAAACQWQYLQQQNSEYRAALERITDEYDCIDLEDCHIVASEALKARSLHEKASKRTP